MTSDADVPRTPRSTRAGLSRRAAIAGTIAVAGVVGLPTATSAAVLAPGSRRTGPYEITPLLDASGTFPLTTDEMFTGASEEDWQAARILEPEAFGPGGRWVLDFRCYLVRGPRGHLTLVDTGVGPVGSPASWAPQPGGLMGRLTAVGVAPADVDVVVLTHLHEDHYGGTVGLDGTPVFPDARYVVQQRELDGLSETDPAVSYVVQPLQESGQLDPVEGGASLGPLGSPGAGVRVVPTPGHTAGHQSVIVAGGRHHTILASDVVVHAVQLVNPDVVYAFEADPDAARMSRHMLLELARVTRARLGTAHLHRPFATIG